MGPLIVQTTPELRLGHPGRRGPELPGAGRPAADPRVGGRHRPQPRADPAGLLGHDLPGARHPRRGARASTCWATACGTPSTRG
ncbi:MAG: hypothetical protein MZV70_52475 [Desulfobacterales bacterium]|nr:hypothetical protein [Desulfobacterales bacterium]